MDLSAFVSVASLLLWAIAFLYFRAYLKRRTGAERILAELREEVEKLVTEIDSATDRDATLVEERVRSLRVFLEEADRRIASYTREIERRGNEERAYAELGRRSRGLRGIEGELLGGGVPSGAAPVVPFTAPSPQPVAIIADAESVGITAGRPAAEVPRSGISVENGPESPLVASAEPAGAESAKGPRFVRSETPIEPKAAPFAERVAELYRAGFSADLIAKRLGATVAEVDLAVALTARTE